MATARRPIDFTSSWERRVAEWHAEDAAFARAQRNQPQDWLGTYTTTRNLLTFPSFQSWKSSLLILNLLYFALHFYLNYRQHRTVQRSSRPKVLQNILSLSVFEDRKRHQLITSKLEFVYLLWRFTSGYLVLTYNILPLIWFDEGDIHIQTDRKLHGMFNNVLVFTCIYVLYTLILQNFIPPSYFGFTPLREGKTKTALEDLATDLHFPLGSAGLYTCESRDTIITGWPWGKRRKIAIPEEIFEKCAPEEVVALVAAEMGSWKQNQLVQVASTLLSYAPLAIIATTLHLNWESVTLSFGFERAAFFEKRHPFQLIILMMGGLVEPFTQMGNVIAYAISRNLDARLDTLAVKRGHGKNLASGMIKAEGPHDEDGGVYILDWAYGMFRQGNDILPEIVRRLGWTGEEDIATGTETDQKCDHWEDGVALKEGVYTFWRRDL